MSTAWTSNPKIAPEGCPMVFCEQERCVASNCICPTCRCTACENRRARIASLALKVCRCPDPEVAEKAGAKRTCVECGGIVSMRRVRLGLPEAA